MHASAKRARPPHAPAGILQILSAAGHHGGRRLPAAASWPRRTLPAEDLYLSHSVFPFETTIFLERFSLERERFLIFHSCPSAVPGALCAPSRQCIGHIVEGSKRHRDERSLTVSSGRPAPVPDARGSHWLSCCEARRGARGLPAAPFVAASRTRSERRAGELHRAPFARVILPGCRCSLAPSFHSTF